MIAITRKTPGTFGPASLTWWFCMILLSLDVTCLWSDRFSMPWLLWPPCSWWLVVSAGVSAAALSALVVARPLLWWDLPLRRTKNSLTSQNTCEISIGPRPSMPLSWAVHMWVWLVCSLWCLVETWPLSSSPRKLCSQPCSPSTCCWCWQQVDSFSLETVPPWLLESTRRSAPWRIWFAIGALLTLETFADAYWLIVWHATPECSRQVRPKWQSTLWWRSALQLSARQWWRASCATGLFAWLCGYAPWQRTWRARWWEFGSLSPCSLPLALNTLWPTCSSSQPACSLAPHSLGETFWSRTWFLWPSAMPLLVLLWSVLACPSCSASWARRSEDEAFAR